MTIDYYPTILEITGAQGDTDHNQRVDGMSLCPLLRDPSSSLDRDLYWHYPHYHAGGDSPYGAIRSGPWRLIEFYEDDSVELYNLSEDIGEQDNLAARMPDKANSLREKLHAWRNQVGAQMPSPNPKHDPDRAQRVASGRGD